MKSKYRIALAAALALATCSAHAYRHAQNYNDTVQTCTGAANIAALAYQAAQSGNTLEPPNVGMDKPGLRDLLMHAWSYGGDLNRYHSAHEAYDDTAAWCIDNIHGLLAETE